MSLYAYRWFRRTTRAVPTGAKLYIAWVSWLLAIWMFLHVAKWLLG